MHFRLPRELAALAFCLSLSLLFFTSPSFAAERDRALLEMLLENGSITQDQYDVLTAEDDVSTDEATTAADSADLPPGTGSGAESGDTSDVTSDVAPDHPAEGVSDDVDPRIADQVARAIAERLEEAFPVNASYGSNGFRLETRDGNWQTNLQWRAQLRLSWPTAGDPRQVDDFAAREEVTFQGRRLRMKIGGHGYRPWLKYYFEVDLQPTRNADEDAPDAAARVIDWRIDVARWKPIGIRVGQWKIDYNRERVDSSGRQQFVERSIVNRIFTIDRQMGVSLRGHLFEGTPADMRYFFGVFTGEGRGVANDDNNLMYAGRIQWNFLGRDLSLRQTDVERTEKPTASLAFGAAKHTGVCTRWSSGGCGNLDGFASASSAEQGQFRIYQAVQELAFKWQGFSFQQELHWKRVNDRSQETGSGLYRNEFWGGYAQTGYFFHELVETVPEELELAFRYALVREPNETDRFEQNTRQEFTVAANWFFAGHNNKLTVDYSHLTLEDDVLKRNVSDDRVRFQWDISF